MAGDRHLAGRRRQAALALGLERRRPTGVALPTGADGSPDDGELSGGEPLAARRWHFVAASVGPATGRLVLVHRRPGEPGGPADVTAGRHACVPARPPRLRRRPPAGAASPTLTSVTEGSYNGKVDAPGTLPRALGAEDLGCAGRPGQPGRAPWPDLELVQLPRPARDWAQLVRPAPWTGASARANTAPSGTTTMISPTRGWPPAFSWEVPEDIRSGMYAARLTADGHEDVISFYVRPAAGARTAPLAVLDPDVHLHHLLELLPCGTGNRRTAHRTRSRAPSLASTVN